METLFRYLRFRLIQAGWPPRSRVARVGWYLLALDILLFALQKILALFRVSAEGLRGWVTFLSSIVLVLFSVLGFRWLKEKLLWRLRSRLIVTYMFIGVIPAVLLGALGALAVYLFAGQFANFVVTSDLHARLNSLEAVNAAIANELAGRLQRREPVTSDVLAGLRQRDRLWAKRQVCAWEEKRPLPLCTDGQGKTAFAPASFPELRSGAIVRDRGELYLRAAVTLNTPTALTVISSEPLDPELLEEMATGLGEITLFPWGLQLSSPPGPPPASSAALPTFSGHEDEPAMNMRIEFDAGSLPAPTNLFDPKITFGTPLPVVDWKSGQPGRAGALRVQTRPSVLYARLFAALGEFAGGVELLLFSVAIVFAIIELLALVIGTRLTRTITGAVAQLYDATIHVNRGDLSHRIPVTSNDQLSTLANSFNSMTTSLEKLLEEQRENEKLRNELLIAQEVQAQLFPKQILQMASLEVHGFCRPARTVSGDYYDFLGVDSERLILAMGDVSGKGISAALLMATIHSAVRAYSVEGIPAVREAVAAGAAAEGEVMLASRLQGVEVSPGTLLSLLNQQLYESTPMEKYATLFLAIYDGGRRRLRYSNGGHLPPLILREDGSLKRLDRGGMVVGLFPRQTYEEASVQLNQNEMFIAYSDGITEPENDFGEFGEQRLIDLVHEHRHLPLARISELVTAAVDDWIGAQEQPDDITLVLARVQ
jgi:phosphoserine phosphatase RsbU/P